MFSEQRAEGFSDLIEEYISLNLNKIVRDNLDDVLEIIEENKKDFGIGTYTIDFELLKAQRKALISVQDSVDLPVLDGLIEMLDVFMFGPNKFLVKKFKR